MKPKYRSSIVDENKAFEWQRARNVKYTLAFKVLVWKKECKMSQYLNFLY